ncbi:hypothetical protein ADUPG1_009955 [Aduncisulcus paluster]|uniref:Uncharacterized protein n=1 Tax=Aduncisulcus paluster TaxID=2918883 RepID=A0ABQ5L194_9EUKA|nr:hypothetical protein ADUPG1_009955 [Aduncisulcus paluster]
MKQIEDEFKYIAQLHKPLKVASVQKASVPHTPVLESATVAEAFNDEELVCVRPTDEWATILKHEPWVLVGLDKKMFETRVMFLRTLFQDAHIPVLRSCLVRAAGNVSKAAAVCCYLVPEILGVKDKVVFTVVEGSEQDIELQQRLTRIKDLVGKEGDEKMKMRTSDLISKPK